MAHSTQTLFRRIAALLMAPIVPAMVAISPTRSVGAAALVNEPPIVLQIGHGEIDGDLWEWIGQGQPLKQLTNWHYNFDPVLSPDSSQVAYLSSPSFVVQDPRGGGYPPANVWVLNLKTGNAVRVADQPPNASYDNEQSLIFRPTPAWSPDGKQLAWVELIGTNANGFVYNLVVYDVATQTVKTMIKGVPGDQFGEGLNGQTVSWSKAGLAYFADNIDPTTMQPTSPPTLYLYGASGKQLAAVQVPKSLNFYDSGTISWANVDSHPVAVFGLASDSGPSTDYAYDPADNSVQPLSGQLQAYSPAAPQGIALVGGYDKITERTWTLPGASVMLKDAIALSPDGKYAAAITGDGQNQITLYDQQGNATPIDLKLADGQRISWLGWEPIAYRVAPPSSGSG